MEYDFTSKEREFGRIVFAVTLDKKKMTEHIVIGRTEEVRRRLEYGDGEVYYDEARPLGSLLLTFEGDKKSEWNKNGIILRESYGKAFPFETERWKMAAPVSDWLKEKYKSGEPSAIFAAVRTWEDYLNYFNMNHGADLLFEKLSMLYKPFAIYGDYRPWRYEAAEILSNALRDGESNVELWYLEQPDDKPKRKIYPTQKRRFEVIAASSSFLPVIFYYLNKVEEWKFVFQKCKICGKDFLARTRHFELCSDECRKVQAVSAKREFDERVKGDRLEQLDEAAYYYWYNRLRKLRKGKTANPKKAAAFKVEFDKFRKEAVRQKAMVKREKMRLVDFTSWLAMQQDKADRLMGED